MKCILFLILTFIPIFVNGQKYIFIPDTSVSGIKLFDSVSLQSKIPNISDLIDYSGPGGQAYFLNKDGTENLIFTFWPSGVSEIHITPSSKEQINRKNQTKLNIDRFITESNIQLHMTKNELTKVKGTNYKTEKMGDLEIIKYRIDNLETSRFLQRYKLPSYYADYTFKGGLLIKIDFGFENP